MFFGTLKMMILFGSKSETPKIKSPDTRIRPGLYGGGWCRNNSGHSCNGMRCPPLPGWPLLKGASSAVTRQRGRSAANRKSIPSRPQGKGWRKGASGPGGTALESVNAQVDVYEVSWCFQKDVEAICLLYPQNLNVGPGPHTGIHHQSHL